ncbi:MAG: hypothetical protein K2P84_13515, partial [Undibacterium sp.]|nr:hypothetical protein [Undibacterium sp.]
MNIEFSGAQIALVVLNLLLLCLAFFVRLWMTRQQADVDSLKQKHAALADQFHAYQLQCAEQFAQKTELL